MSLLELYCLAAVFILALAWSLCEAASCADRRLEDEESKKQ